MSTNTVIKGCGFHHAAVQTTDYEGTRRFYMDVLGCRLECEWTSGDRRLCLLDLGDGGYIEVISGPPVAGQHAPMIHLALHADDVDAAIARVRAAGCRIAMEPKDVTLGDHPARVAFFTGPNGEVLELFRLIAVDTR